MADARNSGEGNPQAALPLATPAPKDVEGLLEGEVQHVTYQNETSGFRVLKVKPTGKEETIAVVGVFPPAPPGTRIRATGEEVVDRRHGRQFKAQTLIPLAPETLAGIRKYLASGLVPGIGKAFAGRIVKTFGEDTLEVLDRAPERLLEVPGLGGTRAQSIASAWEHHREVSAIMVFLQAHGASPSLATKIFRRFRNKSLHIVSTSPYRLALDVWGVGFKTADTIARSLGVGEDAPERAQAGVLHTLHELAGRGHCFAPRPILIEAALELLGGDPDRIEEAIEVLSDERRVVLDDLHDGVEAIYAPELRRAEEHVAQRLALLLTATQRLERVDHAVAEFEKLSGLTLAATQRDAVALVAEHKVTVITGGPGVGKTTIVRALLALFDTAAMRVKLAAPTGRAAKRMGEATGRKAMTIHRLLDFDPKTGSFLRDADKPLECDALIIDETSMVAIDLAASLFDAVPDHARVVLVGDVDQLPSVGPGAVLRDVIESQVVPTVRLEQIFRQADGSGIVENAHRINTGEMPRGATAKDAEFYVFPRRGADRAVSLIEHLVTERIPAGFGLDPMTDIQVLTPMQKGPVGAILLNERLQAKLNGGAAHEVKRGNRTLRLGDKVMQLSNDYEKEVFNGDVGRVVALDPHERKLAVDFEGHVVPYEENQLDDLTLAYATSIHKSQGSEYPAVVIPVLTNHFVMLSRNLLYTAVTRGKRLVILVADPRALSIALGEVRKEARRTRLAARIVAAAEAAEDDRS